MHVHGKNQHPTCSKHIVKNEIDKYEQSIGNSKSELSKQCKWNIALYAEINSNTQLQIPSPYNLESCI